MVSVSSKSPLITKHLMVSDLGMIVALLALLLSISAGTYIILSKCFPDFGVTCGVQAEDHNHKSLSSVPDHNDLARDNSTSRHKTMLSSEVPDNQEQTFSNIPTHDYSAEPLLITPGPEGAKENCGLTNNTNHDAEENDADQRHDHDHHYNSLQKATQSDKCISSNGGLHHSNGQKNGMVDKLRQPKDPILVHPDEVKPKAEDSSRNELPRAGDNDEADQAEPKDEAEVVPGAGTNA
ncbi:hypothetical protein TCAL_16450 [Tigriopus californicus]|uniref:Uncharacterized protein n=1 Tax=Tigriopus californicus TaxID=6832 RepID=A0A553NY93_TIGCA|nr:hypothetical protein TCAL_16450 [Tigriopus californicus]